MQSWRPASFLFDNAESQTHSHTLYSYQSCFQYTKPADGSQHLRPGFTLEPTTFDAQLHVPNKVSVCAEVVNFGTAYSSNFRSQSHQLVPSIDLRVAAVAQQSFRLKGEFYNFIWWWWWSGITVKMMRMPGWWIDWWKGAFETWCLTVVQIAAVDTSCVAIRYKPHIRSVCTIN